MTNQEVQTTGLKLPPGLSSTQLNIVTVVDVARVLCTGGLNGCVGMMDNSPDSLYKGDSRLQTVCRQGQTLNWLLYCMDTCKRPDGRWPPLARIANIVFIEEDGTPCSAKICSDLKVYGAPDKMRTPLTPVYYYWAGTVMPELKPGNYRYRLILECDTFDPDRKALFNLDSPALQVVTQEDTVPNSWVVSS